MYSLCTLSFMYFPVNKCLYFYFFFCYKRFNEQPFICLMFIFCHMEEILVYTFHGMVITKCYIFNFNLTQSKFSPKTRQVCFFMLNYSFYLSWLLIMFCFLCVICLYLSSTSLVSLQVCLVCCCLNLSSFSSQYMFKIKKFYLLIFINYLFYFIKNLYFQFI